MKRPLKVAQTCSDQLSKVIWNDLESVRHNRNGRRITHHLSKIANPRHKIFMNGRLANSLNDDTRARIAPNESKDIGKGVIIHVRQGPKLFSRTHNARGITLI